MIKVVICESCWTVAPSGQFKPSLGCVIEALISIDTRMHLAWPEASSHLSQTQRMLTSTEYARAHPTLSTNTHTPTHTHTPAHTETPSKTPLHTHNQGHLRDPLLTVATGEQASFSHSPSLQVFHSPGLLLDMRSPVLFAWLDHARSTPKGPGSSPASCAQPPSPPPQTHTHTPHHTSTPCLS